MPRQATQQKTNSKVFMTQSSELPLTTILCDHGVFYPQVLAESPSSELSLAAADQVVEGSDLAKLKYGPKNPEIEYEVICNSDLSREARSSCHSTFPYLRPNRRLHHTTRTVLFCRLAFSSVRAPNGASWCCTSHS